MSKLAHQDVAAELLRIIDNEDHIFAKDKSTTGWSIAIHKENKSIYATNGKVIMAIRLHPKDILESVASHQPLLEIKNYKGINKIHFIQKFIASGTKKSPNINNVAFTQALEYSFAKYYGIPLFNETEQYVADLFSSPGSTITPTLSLFNLLLTDFISKNPKGVWRSHIKNYTHFSEMVICHKKVQKDIEIGLDSKHKVVIMNTLQMVIKCLYQALQAFGLISKEELELMKMPRFQNSDEIKDFKDLFLGNFGNDIPDLFYAKATYTEEKITEWNLLQIKMLQSLINLKPYCDKKGIDFLKEFDKHFAEFKKSRKYIVKLKIL